MEDNSNQGVDPTLTENINSNQDSVETPTEGQNEQNIQENTESSQGEMPTVEEHDRLESLLETEEESWSDEDAEFYKKFSHLVEDAPDTQASLQQILNYEASEATITSGNAEEMAAYILERDKNIAPRLEQSFFNRFAQLDPELANAMSYVMQGGNSRDFYNSAEAIDNNEITDKHVARSILQTHYATKGINSSVVENIIAGFESEELLIEHAKELSELSKNEKIEKQKAIIAQQQEEQNRLSNLAITAASNISQKIERGAVGTFVVPVEQRTKFDEYIRTNTRVLSNGELAITTRFKQEDLDAILQAEWFKFAGGDLTKLIQRSASTMKATELKKRLKVERPSGNSSGGRKFSLGDMSNTK